MKKRYTFALFAVLIAHCASLQSQTAKNVLFLGNSYTAYNNLGQLTATLALSAGDTLNSTAITPGGYTLEGHSTNNSSINAIKNGNWDFVILQEQSQRPSFPSGQVAQEVFPYARTLDSLINHHNNCAETVFYMTWGRKNGDASNCQFWPPVCTYEGMDSLLNLRYRQMANYNNAVVSPVGAVWHYIRDNHPNIELYANDGSHPSFAGSYAAACSFYTSFFRKDPKLITNYTGLDSTIAATIRNAASIVVYDSLSKWNIGAYDPVSSFNYSWISGNQYQFTENTTNATDFLWDFGDGTTSTQPNPIHTYASQGNYTVKLFASQCDLSSNSQQVLQVGNIGLEEKELSYYRVYPNPTRSYLHVSTNTQSTAPLIVRILDLRGKLVYHQTLTSSRSDFQIDVSDLKEGIYLIQLNGEEVHRFTRIN